MTTGFYNYLESIMPIRRILISVAVGMVPFFIVLISGLTSDFVRGATVASRTFSAFSFTSLTCFILMMSCEEYAIFKTKRELENFIDDAPLAVTNENFNRAEYLHVDVQPAVAPEPVADNSFHPMNFANFSNQH